MIVSERGADRRVCGCLRLPRLGVLHLRTGRSRIKSESDFAGVYASGIVIWLSLVVRHQSAHRLGRTVGRRRCRRCGRVLGMGETTPSFPESCGSLWHGTAGNSVCVWAGSMRTGDSRCFLGQRRNYARVSAWRPLNHALLLDRDFLGLPRFLQRMDPMLGSSCSCCATDAESLRHRISSLLTSSLLSGPGFAIACRVSTRVLSSFCRRRPGDARAIRRRRVPLPHQVKGPLFHLVESPAQILADYPQKNQLEPAKEQDSDQQ